MKNKKRFQIYLFIVIGFVLMCTNGCDKTDDSGDDLSSGNIKDIDGNVYHTVTIGSQVWMVENLKTTKYNDGSEITNVTSDTQWENLTTGAYCNYDNLESNATTYGRLYNWYAVNTGKLAPAGWHVPTDDDWFTLADYVAANLGISGSVAKALASTTNWVASTEGEAIGNDLTINNSTGFTALPGGYRGDGGKFDGFGEVGSWWSSTEVDNSYAYDRGLGYFYDGLLRDYDIKESGFSVRLVRD